MNSWRDFQLRYVWCLLLFALLLACGKEEVEPAGQQTQAARDTVASEPEPPPAPKTRRPAQRAWDTSDTAGFDVDEVNRRRREAMAPPPPPPPLKLDTLRVRPSDIPDMPQVIVEWLEAREYFIPQARNPEKEGFTNAISGEFIKKSQLDWAIYAIRDSLLDLLVFENCDTSKIDTIFNNDLAYWWAEILYFNTTDSIATLNEVIHNVDEDYIKYYHNAFGGLEPPDITHDAISLYVIDKGSTVYYFHEGNWLRLQGAD